MPTTEPRPTAEECLQVGAAPQVITGPSGLPQLYTSAAAASQYGPAGGGLVDDEDQVAFQTSNTNRLMSQPSVCPREMAHHHTTDKAPRYSMYSTPYKNYLVIFITHQHATNKVPNTIFIVVEKQIIIIAHHHTADKALRYRI